MRLLSWLNRERKHTDMGEFNCPRVGFNHLRLNWTLGHTFKNNYYYNPVFK